MASERLHEALAGLSTLTTAAQRSLTRLYHTLEETIHSEDHDVVAKPWVLVESNLIEVQAQEDATLPRTPPEAPQSRAERDPSDMVMTPSIDYCPTESGEVDLALQIADLEKEVELQQGCLEEQVEELEAQLEHQQSFLVDMKHELATEYATRTVAVNEPAALLVSDSCPAAVPTNRSHTCAPGRPARQGPSGPARGPALSDGGEGC